MAVTNQELFNIFLANPNMSDAQIVSLMETRGISPEQVSSTFGIPVSEVVSRVAATVPAGSSVTLGDTRVTPQYQTTGSGMDQQIGGIQNIYLEKTTGDVNYKAPVGSDVQVLSPTGELVNTIKTKEDLSFTGGLVDALKDPVVLAALGGAAAGGLLGGTAAGTAAGTAGMTTAELAQLDLALGGAGGTAGANTLATALTTGATVPTLTNLTGGSGVLTGAAAGITAESVAAKLAADAAAQTALTTTGLLTPPVTTGVPPVVTPPTVTPPVVPPTVTTPPVVTTPTGVPPVVTTPTGIPSIADITKLASTGLTAAQIAQLLSTGATTAAGLLQQQTSKEAAQKAQAVIDAETAAAKAASQFRPVGMTTRFGSSNFQVDPKTGQITSAGYTLSPEAKAAQDRFVNLAGQGLTQAEQAQQQFAPLQTGAQSLFSLGNQYLAQSPEQVAQNYLNQQMALLQPGRELELANLQNRLQQQGRGGLSVAQGGNLGATTPELQALFNARAQQEALLAAQAQQAGQQQVAFGANLLGQGAQTMGQYYGGQTAAYAPYTNAFGQIQALESAGQQPLTMGAQLGQTAAQAGANVGQMGLKGAQLSTALATSDDATRNLYASLLGGVGSSNLTSGLLTGGLNGLQAGFSNTALGSSGFGTGLAYGNQDLGLFL